MKIIYLKKYFGKDATNKDIAREIREDTLIPLFESSENGIILSFKGIDSSSQSIIHALISKLFQEKGQSALKRLEFKDCNKGIKNLITTVINYSLE